jgi:flavin reductase (DIM6/NTAB) family NADH-FMN oxidoreductase RutF
MLGKDGKGVAFTFFKPTKLEDGKLSGEAIHKGSTGAPILDAARASVECKVTCMPSRATTTSSSPRSSMYIWRSR